MSKRLIFIFIACCWACIGKAQSTGIAEDYVSLDFNSGIYIDGNDFSTTWDASPAGHVNIRASFFAGELEAGVRYTRFQGNAPSDEDSDFHSLFIHLGYSYPLQITSRYSIAPTLRFGNHYMAFDESAVFTNDSGTERFRTDQSESEFAYELALRNQLDISNQWSAHATVSYNRTLTYFPLSVTLISAGITYSFPQSNWIKKLIQ